MPKFDSLDKWHIKFAVSVRPTATRVFTHRCSNCAFLTEHHAVEANWGVEV